MSYDAIIIGAGLGGLLTTALLAKRGKKVLLLEQHSLPGGCCTSYSRQGFTLNVPSVLNEVGAGEAGEALASIGFLEGIATERIANFARYVYPDLEVVMPAEDLDGCRSNMLEVFPREASAIDRFFADVRKVRDTLAALTTPRSSWRKLLSLLLALPRFQRLARLSFHGYLKRFTDDERLVTVLSSHWGYLGLPPRRASALSMLLISGECFGRPILFPRDGFQAVADSLASKVRELGGEIRLRTAVARILIERRKAVGVQTAAGEQIRAGTIISNGDTRKTFLELVGRAHLSRRFAAKIEAHQTSMSGLSLHVGTDLDLTGRDLRYGGIFCDEAWCGADAFYDRACANEIDFRTDAIQFGLQVPSLLSERLAPPGRHLVHVLVMPVSRRYDDGFRTRGGRRGKEYRLAKQRLTEALLAKVERIVPGLSGSVVLNELATPFTFERYTGATGGAWYDGVSPADGPWSVPSPRTPIRGLLMTGVKASTGGGMPAALMGGFTAAKAMLAAKAWGNG